MPYRRIQPAMIKKAEKMIAANCCDARIRKSTGISQRTLRRLRTLVTSDQAERRKDANRFLSEISKPWQCRQAARERAIKARIVLATSGWPAGIRLSQANMLNLLMTHGPMSKNRLLKAAKHQGKKGFAVLTDMILQGWAIVRVKGNTHLVDVHPDVKARREAYVRAQNEVERD